MKQVAEKRTRTVAYFTMLPPVKSITQIALICLCLFSPFSAYSQTLFEQGQDLFLQNQLEEAREMFQAALQENPQNEQIYLYLGYIYEQREEYEQAVSILQRGLEHSQSNRHVLLFNIANNFLKLGRNTFAERFFTQAIQENSNYARAYLNRANTRLRTENYTGALADFTLYLNLQPGTPQRENITAVIELLRQEIAAQEEAERQAELAQQQAEEEERRRREEERRRREELLDSVMSSLQTASEETENLSAGTEEIQETVEELELED
ncbi:MAG: tetratricopeptide repeat protein [Spirochaetia bacterium]